MKTIFYSLAAFALLGFSQQLSAQCTIDAANTELFAYPTGTTTQAYNSNDPDTAYLPPLSGLGYSAVFHLNIPEEIDYQGNNVEVLYLKIESIDGLPDGLSYQCDAASSDCQFFGGSQGCVEIYGDYTSSVTAGTDYVLDIQFSGEINYNSFNVELDNDAVQELLENTVAIIQTTENLGVEGLDINSEISIAPNPASTIVSLDYEATDNADINLQLIDMQGRVVLNKAIESQTGSNHIELDVEHFSTGMYQVVMQNEKGYFSSKLMIE